LNLLNRRICCAARRWRCRRVSTTICRCERSETYVWIKSFKIENYKSFDNSGLRDLGRGINVVIGQNHSGKTALLGALARRFRAIPHKSSRLRRTEAPNPISVLDLDFVVAGSEVRDIALAQQMNLQMPVPSDKGHLGPKGVLQWVLSLPEMVLSVQGTAHENGKSSWSQPHYPSNNLFPINALNQNFIHFNVNQTRTDFHIAHMSPGANDYFSFHFVGPLADHTYYFDAQRIPQNDFAFGSAERLSSDAANLAQVLNVLQANRSEFAEYVSQVRRIVPLIKWISVVPSKERGQNVEIRIWNVDESTGRDDLTVPLAECGTGIGQVLSILYVVLKSEGNIIVIDEPNSFLHPRAAKALVSMLRNDSKNQYIVSTHSPEILVASDPDRLFMLKFVEEATQVQQIARGDIGNAKEVLDEIGSRLSDVFGADRVLWVEGPTETECYPLLLKAEGRELEFGTAIAPLRNTGDLESRHGEAIADIYRNLSSAYALLPSPIGVSLDGDKRDMPNLKTLERAFGKIITFLPRRCYENYLLHPAAIAHLLNATGSVETSETSVRDWFRNRGSEPKYKVSKHEPLSAAWSQEVDAPALLDDLFQELSAGREIYRKTLHSPQLTKWLLENDRGSLEELIKYVVALIPRSQ